MVKNVKRFICIVAVILIAVCTINGLSHLFRPVYTDDAVSSIRAFKQVPANSLDVIVYGSSHSWLGIDTDLLNKKYGIEAFNYSCMWQSINTVDLFVNDSFNTQTPKVAVVDVGRVNEILRDAELNGEIYYTREIEEGDIKNQYLRDCFGDGYMNQLMYYYFPFGAFHSNWNSLKEKSFTDEREKTDDFLRTRGFMGFKIVSPVEMWDDTQYWQEPLPEDVTAYLDDIVNVCNAHGTKVIFTCVPFYSTEYMYRDAMAEYAQNNGCDFVDFFSIAKELGVNGDEDFYDNEHLNIYGADKITDYLGEYISTYYLNS